MWKYFCSALVEAVMLGLAVTILLSAIAFVLALVSIPVALVVWLWMAIL